MARNLLEQHVYSHDSEPPYKPSLIRLPAIRCFSPLYSVFGHCNNTAVRLAHAVIDTLTCCLVRLVAWYWAPAAQRKRGSALGAFVLAALCPFPVIYIATILTETWASFFAVALCLLTTLAFMAQSRRRALLLWTAVGLLGGLQVFFRPDSGLFVFAVGLTLVATLFSRADKGPQAAKAWSQRLGWVGIQGLVLSAAFVLVLVPWTIRNWRTFHVFQPLAPAHAEMPGEFVPRGYLGWLRTWIDDGRYVETVLWPLDDKQISMDEMPESAFDSEEEEVQVAHLLEQYNHPPQTEEVEEPENSAPAGDAKDNMPPNPTPSPSEPDDLEPEEPSEESVEEPEEPESPEMTPAIDAEFAKLAQERIARHPVRYYLWLPLKRAWALWANTHADYYPFSGEIFPLDDMDYSIHQHIWLPLFGILVLIYSLVGFVGGWRLWRAGTVASRRWLLLVSLLIFIRLAFFSTLENPEPRYTVEFFPFLAILGGLAISRIRV